MSLALVHIWFEAMVGEHRIRLGLEGSAKTAPHAAIALYQVDQTLQAISQWLGTDPVWQWLGVCGNDQPLTSDRSASIAPVTAPDSQVLLDLPATLEQSLAPAPAALAARLKVPALVVQLVAARFPLSREEVGLLESGGAIMLAESTGPEWRGFLRSPEVAECPVVIHSPEHVSRRPQTRANDEISNLNKTARETASGTTDHTVEIRLGSPLSVATSCLRDEFDGELNLGAACGQTRLASLWPVGDEVTPLAVGELIPLGRGWAMLIRQVFDPKTVGSAKTPLPIQ